MKTIKAGLIGAGPRGRYMFTELIACPEVEAFGVADVSEEALELMRKEFEKQGIDPGKVRYYNDYREMIKDGVEAVFIASGVPLHADMAVTCVRAGVHVLCEIPIINTLEGASELLKACRDNPQVTFMTAENCCYWGFIRKYREMYDQGLLGDIVIAEGEYLHGEGFIENFDKDHSTIPRTWRSYNPAVVYCTHETGPLFYALDDEPVEVTGFIPGFNPAEGYRPAPSNGMLIIKTKKGTLIKITIGFGMHQPICAHNFLLYGTKGNIQNERFWKTYEGRVSYAQLRSDPNDGEYIRIPVTTEMQENIGGGHGGGDRMMMRDFVHSITTGTPPVFDLIKGIQMALPGILGHQSSMEGSHPIRIPTIEELLDM
ncbi:MAG: Gfo/Idh/MocA family oxidoreductase [Ruminococcaceae bacterium]|nr:Gfo/Idh/MocA family oxidoreductase [Oscillospiraceae bacterium]